MDTKMAPGGPGGFGPMALSPEWTLDFLAPSGVPQKKLHIDVEKMTGIIETEHGSQEMKDLKYEDGRLTFKALLGSNGDEPFIVELKVYMGGIMLGEARACAARVLEADPELQDPRNAMLLKELRKSKYDIKDYSKIS